MSDSVTADRPVACVRLSAGEPFVGKQGFTYAAAVSAETVGASAIHMQLSRSRRARGPRPTSMRRTKRRSTC